LKALMPTIRRTPKNEKPESTTETYVSND
jgi:hypothetical protein